MGGIKQRLIILLVCIALCVGTCNAAAVVETVDTFELPSELLSKRVIEENPIDITGELMPIYGSASTAEFDRGKVKFGTETLWISTKSDITVQNTGLFGTKLFASENWVDIESESVTNIDKNEISWITSDVYIKYHYNDTKLKEEIILEKPSKIVVNYEISDGSHIIQQPDRTLKLTNFRENILIERPFAIDGNGKKFVLDWEINRETQQFMLVGDLSSAKYPLVVDPTLVLVEEPDLEIMDFALDSDNNPHILYTRNDPDNSSTSLLVSHMSETGNIITTTVDTWSYDDFEFADSKIIIGDDSVNILYSGMDSATYNGIIVHVNLDDLVNKSIIFERYYCELYVDGVITDSSNIYAMINSLNYMTYMSEVHYLDFDGDSWSNITITEHGIGLDITLHDSRPYICYSDVSPEYISEAYLCYSEYNGDDFTNIMTIPSFIDRADSEIDSNGNIHIIYTDYYGNLTSKSTSYAFYDGNIISYDIVDEYSDTFALSVDSNNNPHVVYETKMGEDNYAFLNETGWEYAPFSLLYQWGNPIFDRDCNPYVPYLANYAVKWVFGYYYYDGDSWSDHVIDDVPRLGVVQTSPSPIMISDDFGGIHAIYAAINSSAGETISIRYYYYETPPIANFTTNTTETNEHTPIQFADMSTGNVLVYNWSFGDGNFSFEQNPIYTYPTFGNYTVSLTVENEGGSDTETKPGYILVHNATAVPDFTANHTEVNENWPIQFNDTSTGTVHDYLWEFGNGVTSIEQNPVYAYPNFGNYTVNLTTSNDGGTTFEEKTDYIVVHNTTPVPDFTANHTEVNENWPIQFNDTSTGTVFTWDWDFGDGTGSTDQNPVHSYPNFGTYTVNLTTSNDGGTTFEEKTNYITVHNATPIAQFSVNRTEVNENWPIQFTDGSLGTVHNYFWEFGNGVTSIEQNPVYAYPTFGLYTVRLTVSNDGGDDIEEKISHVVVHNTTPVINDFTANVLESEYPVSIHFTPDITGTVHNYYWDFGDGQGSSTSNPDHTYTYAGWFTVELDAANDGGQDAMTKTNYIQILSHYPICEWATQHGGDRTLRFIDHSYVGEFDEPITEYSWDFGDGATSTEKNPVHFYPSIGQGDPFHNYFDVTHGVKNARGWTYTTATVDVHNDPNWVPVKPESGSMSFLWLPYNDLYLSEFISQNPLDDTVEIDNVGLVATCIMWLQAHTAQMGVLIASLIVVTVLTLKTQSVFALFLSMSLVVSHMTTSWCPEEAKFLLWVILAISLVGIILKPIVGRT